ncbi:hypothetical protein AAHA92_15715 [Salvia divinorum]|uniref:Uncharacterized protein n=1 Tax=Salvia divinorum TaxID=28513 RepID=A0ABD1HJK5_SALDI
MEVIEEFAANSRGWSKERHNMKRVATIENNDDTDLAKQIAALRIRVDKMDNAQKEDSTPTTSVIQLAQKDAPPAVEDVNYVQNSGGPMRTYNNYRPNQGGGNFNNYSGNRPHPNLSYANNNYIQPPAGFNVSKGEVVEPPKKDERERYEQRIQRILEAMQEDRKANDTKIGVVEQG